MENKKVKHHRSKKKIVLITAVCILAVFFLVLMPILTVIVYHDNFGERFETAEWMTYSVNDFENLKITECTFPSNNGQLLAGYQYSKENQDTKGVVVIAHGYGGGGHNIRYIKQINEYQGLPIVLFGHSWGGYSVGSVLNCHADVKAAVLVAGFDRSTDLFEQQGESMIGAGIKLFMPYVSLYERLKFGKYAAYSAKDGFANSDAGIMVIHSKDDTTVLPENGYEKFYHMYGGNSRFCFVEYEDRGHDYIYYSEAAQRYREQLNKDYIAYVEANGGEYNAGIKAEFMKKHLDKSKCYEFDFDLMRRILEFYDSCSTM